MNVSSIKDPAVRAQFQEIAEMREEELFALGLNSDIRNQLLDGIIVPPDEADCWTWGNAYLQCGPKSRPCIRHKRKVFLAYRVLMALVARKNIQELKPILHKCPGMENCKCINLSHLKEAESWESAAKENAQDRSRYGTLHGDRNGSRLHPESRPRGRNNPKSKFRGPGGERMIQTLRATYDAYADKEGVTEALSRWTAEQGNRCSRVTVGKVVRRELHNDVSDDPSAALDPSQIDVKHRADSAKRRTHWASGDECKRTRMPIQAKRAFVSLVHRIRDKSQKRELINYLSLRYRVDYAYVQEMGYLDPTKFGAPSKADIRLLPVVDSVTPELLEVTFGNITPLGLQREAS